MTTPDDAILSKLEWQSKSPSDSQRRDVVQMMIANLDSLDRQYLERWATELGVRSLLNELLEEAARAQ